MAGRIESRAPKTDAKDHPHARHRSERTRRRDRPEDPRASPRDGLSQAALAEACGVTFQQIQKYERGANRVSFSRLAAIAQALHCRVGDLAAELEEVESPKELRKLNDLVAAPGALELLELFARVRSRGLRRAIVAHVRALGEADAGRA